MQTAIFQFSISLHNHFLGEKWDATSIESGPRYIYYLKSFVFSEENYLYCLYFHDT